MDSLVAYLADLNSRIWVERAKQNLRGDDLNLFAVIISNMWLNRNQVLHVKVCFLPCNLYRVSKELLDKLVFSFLSS